MKVLVCGDRNWTNIIPIREALQVYDQRTHESGEPLIVIHGAAKGADTLAEIVGNEIGAEIQAFPAKWDTHGKAAGPIRNQQMLNQDPDVVLALHDDLENSRGTGDMVRRALRKGTMVYVWTHQTSWWTILNTTIEGHEPTHFIFEEPTLN